MLNVYTIKLFKSLNHLNIYQLMKLLFLIEMKLECSNASTVSIVLNNEVISVDTYQVYIGLSFEMKMEK